MSLAATDGLPGATWRDRGVDDFECTRRVCSRRLSGLQLFLAPWLAGFADGEAAWAAWVPGFTATTLGVAGYLRGESLDFTTTVRDDADARYRQRYG